MAVLAAEQKCRGVGFGAILSGAQIHIHRAADRANNRGGNDPFGLGVMLMRRREFVGVLGGAAVWPLAARAQQANKLYRIGYLSLGSLAAEASRFNAFRAGLAALGYIEGKNLVIETRWLEGGKYDQLAELAAQLVDLKVDVIVTYSTPGVSAAQRATTTIPIVFLTVGDAIAMGFVSSGPPGRQCNGNDVFQSRTCRETPGVSQGGHAQPGARGCLVQSCKCGGPAGPRGHEIDRAIAQGRAIGVCGARRI